MVGKCSSWHVYMGAPWAIHVWHVWSSFTMVTVNMTRVWVLSSLNMQINVQIWLLGLLHVGTAYQKYTCIFERSLPYEKIILDKYILHKYIYIYTYLCMQRYWLVSDLTISNMPCVLIVWESSWWAHVDNKNLRDYPLRLVNYDKLAILSEIA